MKIPETYQHWQNRAHELLEPLLKNMRTNSGEIVLTRKASDHDANADRLEAFARPMLLAALWLQSEGVGESREGQDVAKMFREGLITGSDPTSKLYWGPNTNYHQNGVEIGLLVCALEMAREYLWDPIPDNAKHQIGQWIASNRGTGHHWNNHMYFGVLALEFLETIGMGRPADRISIDYWFKEMEGMYRGDGWFMDGMNQSYDHYNSYAFHFYGLLWGFLYGDRNPARRDRWAGWAKDFLDEYQHMFSAKGEHPAFGRSITYRFNASAPFSLACLMGVSPLSAGRARRLCTRNLESFLHRGERNAEGILTIGWHDEFPELSEAYSCEGSVYWASKAFVSLLLPPTHEFWTAKEEKLASEAGDYVRLQKEAGLIIRSVEGEVEIINVGSEITPVNMPKFGPWKWGKLAYRSGLGFQIGQQGEYYGKLNGFYSLDSGVTMTGGSDSRIHGRHYTLPLAIEETHAACTYALGDKVDQLVTVMETYLWWKAGWVLQVHWFDAYQQIMLKLGGYSIAAQNADVFEKKLQTQYACVKSNSQGSAFQALSGISSIEWDERLDDSQRRSHIEAPYHVCPVGNVDCNGKTIFAALVWTGTDLNCSQPWHVKSGSAGSWELEHPLHGEWKITHNILPGI